MAITSIQLDQTTRQQLKSIGRKGETYDQILRRLLAASEYAEFMEDQYELLRQEKHWIRLRKSA